MLRASLIEPIREMRVYDARIYTRVFPRLYITFAVHAGTRRGSRVINRPARPDDRDDRDEAERETDFDTNETSVLRANARRCVYNVTHVGVSLGYSCHSV